MIDIKEEKETSKIAFLPICQLESDIQKPFNHPPNRFQARLDYIWLSSPIGPFRAIDLEIVANSVKSRGKIRVSKPDEPKRKSAFKVVKAKIDTPQSEVINQSNACLKEENYLTNSFSSSTKHAETVISQHSSPIEAREKEDSDYMDYQPKEKKLIGKKVLKKPKKILKGYDCQFCERMFNSAQGLGNIIT